MERDMANLSKTVNERCSLQVFLLTKLDESCFKINKTSGNIQKQILILPLSFLSGFTCLSIM